MSIEPLIRPEDYTIEKCTMALLHYLRRFEIDDVFRLIGYSYMRLNVEANTSSAYKVSPKLMVNLPFIYAENAFNGKERISDYDNAFNHVVDILEDIYHCHYNDARAGANTNYANEDLATNMYMNFHFNFPDTSIRQYIEFLYKHVDILEHYFKTLTGDQIIRGTLLLMNYERACNKNFKSRMQNKWYQFRDKNCFIPAGVDSQINPNIRTHFSLECIRKLLANFGIPAKSFIDTMFLSVKQKDVISFEYPTNINKKYKGYIGIEHDGYVLIPRNHYVIDRLFNIVEDSELYIDKRKGDYLEDKTYEVCCDFFGKENVYKNLFDENGDDQDIIVLYNGNLLSIECKATKLKEIFINNEKSKTRLQRNFKPSLQKAYSQSERIAVHMEKGTAKFYNSKDKKKRGLILDLATINITKTKSILVTLTPYLNLGTDIHLLLKKEGLLKNPWSVDIFSLEQILVKCKHAFSIEFFMEFLENRIELFGSVYSISGDELTQFGNYIQNRDLFSKRIGGVSIRLGPGYRSFVNNYINEDNFLVFHDYLGI